MTTRSGVTPDDKKRVEEIRAYFKNHEPDDEPTLFFLLAQLDEAHAALRLIMSMAGHPDADEGCRNIIKQARKALGEE